MANLDELPPPDLRDSTGRLRRLVIALLVGGAIGGGAYALAFAIIDPASQPTASYVAHNMSAGGFVIWVGLVSAVVAFAAALALQNHLARRQADRERVPPAKVR